MYCILKYIDYLNYKRVYKESASTLRSIRSMDADPLNVKLYFNPNCVLQLILDYICTEAHINVDGENHDLCNEAGELLGIKDLKPTVNGLTIFQPRENYYIVVLKRNDLGTQIEDITPMLNPTSEIYERISKNIREKNVLKKKRSTLIKKRSSSSKQSVALSHSSQSTITSKGKRRSSANN